ncbi:MAG: hypothetical protein WCD18_19840 [Thermosynechococcaceae cyanobacterium]
MKNRNSNNAKTLNYALTLTFNPEILRIFAYITLLIMFLSGYILTSVFVHVDPTTTAIYRLFGFNHSCNLLDHEPSRTVSAMLLPFWEIPFLLYVIFNFLRIHDAYRENQVPKYTFLIAAIFLPIEIILTVWFRLVFVWDSEISFLNHYLPYVGFQLLLCMTAVENVLYFDAVNALPFNHRSLAIGYLVALFTITFLCILFGLSVALGHPILDSAHNADHRFIFKLLSNLYFIMAVPVPLILSFVELKRSPQHTLSLD